MKPKEKKAKEKTKKEKKKRPSAKGGRVFRIVRALFLAAILCGILAGLFCLVSDLIVVTTQKDKIDAERTGEYDCILVFGAGVKEDGRMSDMLRDRMDTGIDLYFAGAAPKILCSGDHGREEYDEVNAMKEYAVSRGVPSEDVFMDHAGFSTYESAVRAARIFSVRRAILVTQKYHLYRALYDADAFGIEAVGVSADRHTYLGQSYRDVREIFARAKDTVYCLFRFSPTYLGDVISISGSGDNTNDKDV